MRLCPQPLVSLIATAWGDYQFWFRRDWHSHAALAVRYAMGIEKNDKTVEKSVRKLLRNYSVFLADFVRLSHAEVEKRVAQGDISFCGLEYFSAAVASGRPLLFVGLHLGNWAIGLDILITRLARPVHIFSSPFGTDVLRWWLHDRQHFLSAPATVGNGSRGTVRAMRVLREGQAAVLMIDAPEDTTRSMVTFLGKKAWLSTLPGYLAEKTGALVLPIGVVHTARNRWSVFVGAPIDINSVPDAHTEVTQRIAWSLEPWVRRYPAQWFLFHSLWQPVGVLAG